ncbi:MAG: protease inhibitor I42 family protein [Fimbriimonadaceae bacterium]|nr:protease inhibitor I42 family protein [Fimbriimonadaceae bacterium]
MKLSPILLGFALAVGVLISGQAQADTITIDEGDHRQQVTLDLGDTLVVNLNSNASTGYSWNIAQNNTSLLRPLGRPTYQNSDSGLMGAGGTQTFRFRAVGAGGEGLRFLYQRPNSGGIQAADTFQVLVVINRPNNRGKNVTVSDIDNHTQVSLNLGDTLTVRLSANSTTGYQWNVGNIDNSVLRMIDSQYIRPRGGLMGAGGTQVYRFRTVGRGSFFLGLLYQRPGASGGIPAAQRFEIQVQVNSNLLGAGG